MSEEARAETAQWLANLTIVPQAVARPPDGSKAAAAKEAAKPKAKGKGKGRRSTGGSAADADAEAKAEAEPASSAAAAPPPPPPPPSSYIAHSGHARRVIAEKSASEEPTPAAAFSVGMTVEVLQEDEGFEGAYYGADVLEIYEEEQKAQVRYHAFDEEEEGGEKLKDRVNLRRLRPPPPKTPPSFLASLAVGGPLEFSFEDGWWQATLVYVSQPALHPPAFHGHGLPAHPVADVAVGTEAEGLDEEKWVVALAADGKTHRWQVRVLESASDRF